jgi:hypothetical protein
MTNREKLEAKAKALGLDVIEGETNKSLGKKIADKVAENAAAQNGATKPNTPPTTPTLTGATQQSNNTPKPEKKAKAPSDDLPVIVEALKIIRHKGEAVKIGDPIELSRADYLDLRKHNAVTIDPDAEDA